jgi:hypothetical protein
LTTKASSVPARLSMTISVGVSLTEQGTQYVICSAPTAQTFAYLRNRLEGGEPVLPDGSSAVGQIGQQALQNRD